jgi:hypothetical protein
MIGRLVKPVPTNVGFVIILFQLFFAVFFPVLTTLNTSSSETKRPFTTDRPYPALKLQIDHPPTAGPPTALPSTIVHFDGTPYFSLLHYKAVNRELEWRKRNTQNQKVGKSTERPRGGFGRDGGGLGEYDACDAKNIINCL